MLLALSFVSTGLVRMVYRPCRVAVVSLLDEKGVVEENLCVRQTHELLEYRVRF